MNSNVSPNLDLTNKRSIILVGLMGAGKTHLGKQIAAVMKVPFVDTDQEVEKAAGNSIEEIFTLYGETEFRKGEQRVIERLLKLEPLVMATGGGSFMNNKTRGLIKDAGISIWLRADLELLYKRTKNRNNRPLLKDDNPKEVLKRLSKERSKHYAKADIIFDVIDEPVAKSSKRLISAINTYNSRHRQPVK